MHLSHCPSHKLSNKIEYLLLLVQFIRQMNIHRSDESNSEIQALSDIPLHGTPIYRHHILKLEWHMTSPIQRDTNAGELPVSNRIPKYRSMIDSHLPCPHQYRGIHEFAGYHHRPNISKPTI